MKLLITFLKKVSKTFPHVENLLYISYIKLNIHNMTNQLQSGNYMNAKHVIETLNHRFCRPTLASIAEKVCKKHQGEYGIYFNTTDLKNIMMPDLFKELECEVTTHMILSKEEKKSYYNNSLTFDQIAKRK